MVAVRVVLDPSPLGAQDGYRSLILRHIDGRTDVASEMARLPRGAIDAGVRTCLGKNPSGNAPCRPHELKSAAILHADALDFLVTRDPSRTLAAFHVQAGARLLEPLERGDALFVARWYAYVARIYLANRDLTMARSVVAAGLSRMESPDLFVARGLITERQAAIGVPNGFDARPERSLEAGQIPNTPAQAIGDYLRALSLDADHVWARLRLSWIRMTQGDGRAADDAARVFRTSSDPEARYLARLFHGAIAERERNLSEAIHDYEEARREDDDIDTQTACVTLSHAHVVAGDFPRAAAVAGECLTRAVAADDVDPWWTFRAGLLDLTTTKWLHEQPVQR